MERFNIIMIRLFLITLLPAMLCAGGCQSFYQVAEVSMSFPADSDPESNCDTFFIPVMIGSKEYKFIMDTGVAVTVVDDELKPLLGKKISEDKSEDSDHLVEYYEAKKPLKIGILSIGAVACMDIDARIKECDIDGILGENIMNELIVQFDFGNKIFRLSKNASIEDTLETRNKWGVEVPFYKDGNGLHCIDLTVSQGVIETFVLDTGLMGMGLMREDLFNLLKDKGELRLDFNGSVMQSRQKASVLREVSIGSINIERLGFVSYPNEKLPFDGKSILGTQFMKKFQMVTFDLRNERIYFK